MTNQELCMMNNLINCVVETPRGSNAKFNYNPKLGLYELAKLLPAGMVFPYDFGYIPGTKGDDGDPLDVVIISELDTFAGCVQACRIIGAIRACQYESGRAVRNDRYLAIPEASAQFRDISSCRQLPGGIVKELTDFFVQYNKEEGKVFKPLRYTGSRNALRHIAKAEKADADKLVQLLLPLYDNKGKRFPGSIFAAIRKKLVRHFGGVTLYLQSPAQGVWKKQGRQHRDTIVVCEVMVGKIDPDFWQAYKAKLEALFRQEKLVIRQHTIGLL